MTNKSDLEFLELVKSQSSWKVDTPTITPELDDLPLNVFEFRVLCRIIRWGECSEPVKDMAKAIQMDKKTIYETLQRLTDRGFIEKTVNPGYPSVYRPLINY